ncbi:MAG TPA: hypothetical protein VLM79_14150 [Kofleriaceae bacterium]|nr:hypothetical protein [Kofleriaceae bacterium]
MNHRRDIGRARLDLDGADHLLAQHLTAALVRFGSAALGVIDLPPIQQATPSKAELQAVAVIAWAREVETTGLLDASDAIASGVATGALPIDLDDVTLRRLIDHHRHRDERFGSDERHALYDRVLGDTDADLAALVGALSEIGRAPPNQSTLAFETRAVIAGASLAAQLTARGSGITAYAARDIANQIREALDLLATPSVAVALGGGGVWAIVERYRQRGGDIGRASARAAAIRAIIAWLADNAQALPGGRISIGRNDPVVAAALSWSAEAA